VAARLFPQRLARRLDEEQLARAVARSRDVSVVADCRAAVRVGVRDRGVSALHDATEGGVLGGLLELAKAAGVDIRVTGERVLLSPEARAACEALELDPLWTLSEGTLLLSVRAPWALEVMQAIADESIAVAEIGEVVRGHGAVWLTAPDGKVTGITEPVRDGYWDAYARAVREGWS
jgi:hydrogenase maturation factor